MMTAGQFATARRGGLTGYEAEFVKQKTAAGVPLSAVSRMLGRNIESLRDHATEIEPRGVVIEREAPPEPLAGLPSRARSIVTETITMHQVTVKHLLGPDRFPAVCHARHRAMYWLRVAGYHYPDIGRFLGGRDQSTVRRGICAHAKRFGLDVPA